MKLFRDIISIVVVLMIGTFSIRAEEPQPFSRGFQQSTFIPKGQWITGVNVNYSQSSQDDYQFFIIEDISGDSLLAKMIWSENHELLFRGINQLSPNKREILQLQYFSGLSQTEIAAILGLTPANVRVLALRAKRDLKCFLEENGYDFS